LGEFAWSISFGWFEFGLEWWSRWGDPSSPAMEESLAMGGRRPEPRKKDRFSHCSVADEPEPPDLRSTAEIRRYPFAG
jgi:hypothetical protein